MIHDNTISTEDICDNCESTDLGLWFDTKTGSRYCKFCKMLMAKGSNRNQKNRRKGYHDDGED